LNKNLIAVVLLAAGLLAAAPASAQSVDQEASLLLGYSYLNVDQNFAGRGGSHGVIADYTYYMDRRWGFMLSASAHWGQVDAEDNPFQIPKVDIRQYTFLVGPHAALWRTLTSEFGMRAVAGTAWRQAEGANSGLTLQDEWGFAGGFEGHLDFRLSDRIWVRALQPTALWTNFGDQWQFNWRLSTGIVIQAGEILQ
jgi:hypothetical protein